MQKRIIKLGFFVLALLLIGACAEADSEVVTPSLQPSSTLESSAPPTSTPQPANTPSPTPTAEPTATPAVADFRLLADLVWLRTDLGEIWRWETDSPTAECLVGVSKTCLVAVPEEIIDFDYQNGKILILLVSDDDTGEEITYQLGYVDLAQGAYRKLVEEQREAPQSETPFKEIALSPNATAATYSFHLVKNEAEIYYINLDKVLEPKLLGRCEVQKNGGHCSRLDIRWSPDGQRVVWHGNDGLWIYEPDSDPELLIADIIDFEEVLNMRHYYPRFWSSDGRYLAFREGQWESSDEGILEVDTKKTTYIPNTHAYFGTPSFNYILTQENEILLTQFMFGIEQLPEQIIIYNYSLNPNADANWLYETSHQKMNFGSFDTIQDIWETPDGETLYLIWHYPTDGSSTSPYWLLAEYDTHQNEFIELYTITYNKGDERSFPLWLQDASALLLRSENSSHYLTTDGSVSESLDFIVGDDACCFQWVEE